MGNVKEKSKNFVKKHWTPLIVGGILIATCTICRIIYVSNIKRSYVNWFIKGTMVGFHGAIDWFDEEFSELNLRELYEDWAKIHPEEILYI